MFQNCQQPKIVEERVLAFQSFSLLFYCFVLFSHFRRPNETSCAFSRHKGTPCQSQMNRGMDSARKSRRKARSTFRTAIGQVLRRAKMSRATTTSSYPTLV